MIISQRIEKCPECGSKEINYDPEHAEISCRACGYVISDNLPFVETYKGLLDVYYSTKEKELKYVFPNVLRTVEERVIKRAVRDLWSLNYLRLKKHHRKEVIRKYIELYREGWTERRDRKKVLAALCFLVLRREQEPILLEDLRFEDKKKVLDYAKQISRRTDLKLIPGDPKPFIHRFGGELEIPSSLIASALEIYKEGKTEGIFRNKSYKTVALACLLVASRVQGITFSKEKLKSIAKVSLTAQSKLRNRIKEKLGHNKIRNIVGYFS